MKLKRNLIIVPGPPLHLRAGDREIYLFDGDTEPWLPDLLAALRDGGPLPSAPPGEVDAALAKLRAAGVIEDDAPTPKPRATLVGDSPLWPHLRPLVDDGDVAVVHEEFTTGLDTFSRGRTAPWLLVSLQGAWARVGPLFVPGETCCFQCYRTRLERNREHPDAHRAWEAMGHPLRARGTPSHEITVAGLVAAELSRRSLAGRLLVADLDRLEFDVEVVYKVPYCPGCRA